MLEKKFSDIRQCMKEGIHKDHERVGNGFQPKQNKTVLHRTLR